MLAKFSALNPKGPYVSLEKEQYNFCVVLSYIRRACEIRKFVAIAQQWLKNVQNSNVNANVDLLFLCCSRSPLQKLPIVVIQKFCYPGNMTSHFSSLLLKTESLDNAILEL